MSWESLPVELDTMIFTILLEDCNRENLPAFAFATVSRKWQAFFEPIFFRRLVVDEPDLNRLSSATEGPKRYRFSYIRHLWLRLKLATYECYYCQTREPNEIIQQMVNKYPYIAKEDLVDKGEFYRKHRDLAIKYVQDTHPEVFSHQYMAYQPPGMDRFRSTEPLRFDVREPLFPRSDTSPRLVDTQQLLPEVNIVKALVIRRQFYRNISSDVLAKLLRESFLCLETFRDERWLASNHLSKRLCSPGNEELVLTTLRAAAAAAARMPRLETMELWKATPESATLFRYSTKNSEPKITWRINWKRARDDQLWHGQLREY
ncbi:hypothetical protein CEP54_008345 [Fusarium duplospermum]|uniref:DUF6546 domain-containing protein n=1 Tax=Fusarium duplospermum TaxID=1325734 RepID=A0A428PWI0_9HYPO|nr:hypothetical protein CEP54_008345 [Fusarium duplospermum]